MSKKIDIPRPEPAPPGGFVCRITTVDFEAATITLQALAHRLPPLAHTNYVVLRQDDWCAMRAASGIETRSAKTEGLGPKDESPPGRPNSPETLEE